MEWHHMDGVWRWVRLIVVITRSMAVASALVNKNNAHQISLQPQRPLPKMARWNDFFQAFDLSCSTDYSSNVSSWIVTRRDDIVPHTHKHLVRLRCTCFCPFKPLIIADVQLLSIGPVSDLHRPVCHCANGRTPWNGARIKIPILRFNDQLNDV